MRIIILTYMMLVSIKGFAQDKKFERNFNKGKYEKCLKIASAQEAKDKKSGQPEYMKLRTYMAMYEKKKDPALMDKSVNVYKIYKKKVKSSSPAEEISNTLKTELTELCNKNYTEGKKDKAWKYCSAIASLFADTLGLYTTLAPASKSNKTSSTAETRNIEENKKSADAGEYVYSANFKKPAKVPSRTEVINYAEKFVGVKYKWAGESPEGFDCSGYILYVMRNFKYEFNHGAKDQSELGTLVNKENALPGDLVFFGKEYSNGRCKIDHVAMLYKMQDGNPVVIHCSSKGVVIQELKPDDYWGKKVLFYRNILQ